jgi:spermidine synthase
MRAWLLLDSAPTPDGRAELSLYQRGTELSIRVDGAELMNSRQHASEEAMAALACARLANATQPRVLIGGLGMGFTLAATAAHLPANAQIDVAELLPAVIRWNQGPLAQLAGDPLEDPRVTVHCRDVRELVESATNRYDAILLDVDNGPDGLTQTANNWLYSAAGLDKLAEALVACGQLCVWSASPNVAFTKRLQAAGYKANAHRVAARPGGKGARHVVWLASPGRTY